MAGYACWYSDAYGNRIAPLRFKSLNYARVVNEPGSLSITVPLNTLRTDQIVPDARVEVWRKSRKGKTYLETDTIWLTTGWEESYEKEPMLTINAESANTIYDRRIVAYSSSSAQGHKVGAADLLMYEIINENLSAGATDVLRRISSTYFSIEFGQIVSAPTLDLSLDRKYVRDALNEIVNACAQEGIFVFYDIIYTPTGLRTIIKTGCRGVDRRGDGVKFSSQHGNLVKLKIKTDYTDEKNFVYVMGQGQGTTRTVTPVSNDDSISASPFARKETTADNNTSSPSGATSRGNAVLRDSSPKTIIEAEIKDTPLASYGDDWGFGDIIRLKAGRRNFDAWVNAISVKAEAGKESISATLKSYI